MIPSRLSQTEPRWLYLHGESPIRTSGLGPRRVYGNGWGFVSPLEQGVESLPRGVVQHGNYPRVLRLARHFVSPSSYR